MIWGGGGAEDEGEEDGNNPQGSADDLQRAARAFVVPLRLCLCELIHDCVCVGVFCCWGKDLQQAARASVWCRCGCVCCALIADTRLCLCGCFLLLGQRGGGEVEEGDMVMKKTGLNQICRMGRCVSA